MKFQLNSLLLLSPLDFFLSKTAVTIYIILLVVLIFFIVVMVMANEVRKPFIAKAPKKNVDIDKASHNDKKPKAVIDERTSNNTPQIIINGLQKPEVENNTNESATPKDDEVTEEDESRFYLLHELDLYYKNEYQEPIYNEEIDLKKFCDDFRNFAAYKLHLYYDISDIRRFVAGLSVTKILILQGMSGTGKTSLAFAFGEFVKNKTVLVPIQPMWKERTDLIGYYNEFTKKFNESLLLQKLYEANYNKDVYITILDEMNIARIEYYFAEFLSLLELPNPDGRFIDVVADRWENDPIKLVDGRLKLPINMWFIGTANNDDSTFAISDKVYDRAMVLNLDKKAIPFVAPKTKPCQISYDHLNELFTKALSDYQISQRNLKRIQMLDKYMIENFHLTFGNRIMKQIKNYVPVQIACGGTELEALDDILARKIMRKLEAQNPVYVRNQAQGLIDYIDELFGENKLPLCKEYIKTIQRTV